MWTVLQALLVVGLAIVAMWSYLDYVNADALLYALISTQELTLFYWGQDRLVNLVPAIASPISNPTWNFYAQMLLFGCVFYGLVLIFIRHHLASTRHRVSAVASSIALVLTAISLAVSLGGGPSFQYIFEQQYALSLTLFLVGSWLIMDRSGAASIIAASGAIVVSALLIPSTILFAPFAWFLGRDGSTRTRRFALVILIGGCGFGVSSLASSWVNISTNSGDYAGFSIDTLGEGLPRVLEQFLDNTNPVLVTLIIGASCWVLWSRRDMLETRLKLLYATTPLFALVWLLVFSANSWVQTNSFSLRYFFPVVAAFLLLVGAATAEVATSFENTMRQHVGTTALQCCVGVASVVAIGIGVIGLTTDDSLSVLRTAEPLAATVVERDVDVVVGEYFEVWPVVFSARSKGADVNGIANRAWPILDNVIQAAEEQAGTITVLCAGDEVDRCRRRLSAFTEIEWVVVEELATDPPLVAVARVST